MLSSSLANGFNGKFALPDNVSHFLLFFFFLVGYHLQIWFQLNEYFT